MGNPQKQWPEQSIWEPPASTPAQGPTTGALPDFTEAPTTEEQALEVLAGLATEASLARVYLSSLDASIASVGDAVQAVAPEACTSELGKARNGAVKMDGEIASLEAKRKQAVHLDGAVLFHATHLSASAAIDGLQAELDGRGDDLARQGALESHVDGHGAPPQRTGSTAELADELVAELPPVLRVGRRTLDRAGNPENVEGVRAELGALGGLSEAWLRDVLQEQASPEFVAALTESELEGLDLDTLATDPEMAEWVEWRDDLANWSAASRENIVANIELLVDVIAEVGDEANWDQERFGPWADILVGVLAATAGFFGGPVASIATSYVLGALVDIHDNHTMIERWTNTGIDMSGIAEGLAPLIEAATVEVSELEGRIAVDALGRQLAGDGGGPEYALIPAAEVPLISRGTLAQALRSATAEAAGEALESEVDSSAADQLASYRELEGEAPTAELREYQAFLGRLQGFRSHLVAQLHDNALSFHRAIVRVCETADWNARVIGELDESAMVQTLSTLSWISLSKKGQSAAIVKWGTELELFSETTGKLVSAGVGVAFSVATAIATAAKNNDDLEGGQDLLSSLVLGSLGAAPREALAGVEHWEELLRSLELAGAAAAARGDMLQYDALVPGKDMVPVAHEASMVESMLATVLSNNLTAVDGELSSKHDNDAGLVNVREAVKDRRLDIEAKAFARDLGLSVGGPLPTFSPALGIRDVEGGTAMILDKPERFAQITGHAATGHDDIRLILDTEASHHGLSANSGTLTVNGRVVHSTRWHYLD